MALEVKPAIAEKAPSAGALTVAIEKRFTTVGRAFHLSVSFSVPEGISILFGPSGAGKTTLLDCVAGLITPDSGTITFGEKVVQGTGVHVPAPRRSVGYVFQNLALFPHLSVRGNIAF